MLPAAAVSGALYAAMPVIRTRTNWCGTGRVFFSEIHSMKDSPAVTAAREAVALINSSPRTPTVDEIAAIIARQAPSSEPALRPECQRHLDRLDRAFIRLDKVEATTVDSADEDLLDAEQQVDKVMKDVENCASRILNEQVRDLADLKLLADVCFRTLYSDGPIDGPCADVILAAGPVHVMSQNCGTTCGLLG
jgi:hypothetical protein